MEAYISQAISIVAMALQVIAYQFKKNSTYLTLFGIGGSLFAVSFFLLGEDGYASAIINVVGVFKSFTFAHHSRKMFRRFYMYLFVFLYAAATVAISIITMKFDIIAYLILMAQIVGTVSIWTDSARIIRKAQLYFIIPIWLLNCTVNFNIGGILCQLFVAVSILISVKRYGWDGLDK